MKRKVLVTGDRGYIGAVLVPLLLKNDFEVIGVDTEFYKKGILRIISSKNSLNLFAVVGDFPLVEIAILTFPLVTIPPR